MRRAVRNRLLFYGGFLGATLGFYLYQPVRIDLLPRPVPVPNPPVDPDTKALFAKGVRVVVLTAHPDDSEYYAGALLAKLHKAGAEVSLVVMTDGDKGYEPWENAARNRRIRRAEEIAAATRWGAHRITFFGFPDGRLIPGDEEMGKAIQAFQGADWVIGFDGAYPPRVAHRDHTVAGQIAERAAHLAGAKWLVRFATHAPNGTFDLTGFDMEHHTLLDFHRSQFSGEKEERVWNSVFATGLEDGEAVDKEYGLAYRATRLR